MDPFKTDHVLGELNLGVGEGHQRAVELGPVIIDLDETALEERIGVRVGSQATVIVYTGAHPVMNTLGRLYIRLLSYFSYLY